MLLKRVDGTGERLCPDYDVPIGSAKHVPLAVIVPKLLDVA